MVARLSLVLALICLFQTGCSCSSDQPEVPVIAPGSREDLLARYSKAHEKKSGKAVMKLVWTEGAGKPQVASLRKSLETNFRRPLADVRIVPVEADQKLEFTRNGIRYRYNLDIVANLRVEIEVKEGTLPTLYPIGLHEGRHYLAATNVSAAGSTPSIDDVSDPLWDQYVAAQRDWQSGLCDLICQQKPELADLARADRDLQLRKIDLRNRRFHHLLARDPQRIVRDQGLSAYTNFDWTDADDQAVRLFDPRLAALKVAVDEARRATTRPDPKRAELREYFKAEVANSPEYLELLDTLEQRTKKVEAFLTGRVSVRQ